MITSLVQIRRLGESKRAENGRLRVHLKTHNYVERRLKKIAQEIEDQIDCRQCANCCKVANVDPKDRDIERIARDAVKEMLLTEPGPVTPAALKESSVRQRKRTAVAGGAGKTKPRRNGKGPAR